MIVIAVRRDHDATPEGGEAAHRDHEHDESLHCHSPEVYLRLYNADAGHPDDTWREGAACTEPRASVQAIHRARLRYVKQPRVLFLALAHQ